MRKLVCLLAALALLLCFTACAAQDLPQDSQQSGTTQESVEDTTSGSTDATTDSKPNNSKGPTIAMDSPCYLDGHTYTSEVLVDASCTEGGRTMHICTVCGEGYVEEVPSLGHEALPASCVEPSTCAQCGEYLDDPTGHVGTDSCEICGMPISDVPAGEDAPAVNDEANEPTEPVVDEGMI